jgi:hypothetical protein
MATTALETSELKISDPSSSAAMLKAKFPGAVSDDSREGFGGVVI